MLGTDIVSVATGRGHEPVMPGVRVDITEPGDVEAAITNGAPDCVINAAAFTAVDRAEEVPAEAHRVNAEAVGHIASACRRHGVPLVHYSSDYVFSGTGDVPYREDDRRLALSVYGASKLAGERAIEASGADALVLRTQWLFGVNGRSFPRTMWQRAGQRQPTRVVNDQVGRPTCTRDLAEWTWQLVEGETRGVVNAANDGTASWYDVARMIFEARDAADCLTPCGTADYKTAAVRPAYSVLDISRLKTLIGEVPHWTDALERFSRAVAAAD
jgi:dTDP-4-dehydrorhamnose reductase